MYLVNIALSCTARVITLCVSMPLACLYQLPGWCSLSCAPKEEPPELSGFIIPEIIEGLNLDDCGHKVKELEAVSLLSKVLQFPSCFTGDDPVGLTSAAPSSSCTSSSLQVHRAFHTGCLTTAGREEIRTSINCFVMKHHLMLKRIQFLLNNTKCAF